jgi:hypothetical protein
VDFLRGISRTVVGKNYSLLKFDLGVQKLMQRVLISTIQARMTSAVMVYRLKELK